jgi:hypothetical protein
VYPGDLNFLLDGTGLVSDDSLSVSTLQSPIVAVDRLDERQPHAARRCSRSYRTLIPPELAAPPRVESMEGGAGCENS